MKIRHANPAADSAACAAIYAPYVTDSAVSFEYGAPDASELAKRIERYSATHAWLVAEDQGEVVGFAYATPHRDRAAYQWATEVSVYIDARHHRRGVGRALYRALLELLELQGFRIACAGIALPNDASIALHESLGFVPVGVYRGIGFKDGTWRDVGWWQLKLGPQDGSTPRKPGPPARLADR